MEIYNLFDQKELNQFKSRFDQLLEHTNPRWGKMNAAQLLAHCREIQEVCNGKALNGTPFLIRVFRNYIKKSVLDHKAYKRNSPTHHQYIINDVRDFETEKKLFLDSLDQFVSNIGTSDHSLFGTLSKEERNQAVVKHHLHHMEQFGI